MSQKFPFATITFIGLSFAGCGQPSASIAPTATTSSMPLPQTPSEPQTTLTAASTPESPSQTAAPTVAESAPANSAAPQLAAKPNPPAAEPSSAVASLRVIDLLTFPRINQKRVMDQGPTYVYYTGESSIKGADAFYQSEFKSRGWMELPNLSPPSEQYSDRLFSKDGNYVRATVSSGGKAGEIGVNLSNLGNVDARLLPMMEDAAPTESTPVNAGHATAHSIIEVAESLSAKLTELGWQEVRDFFTPDIDVPHYRSIKYRKNAMRINLGIYRDPQNPADKTKVFYHSEFAIPFDIPTPDPRKLLKLDLTSMKAAFEYDAEQADMFALFEKSSEGFGWKFKNAEPFQKADVASLLISSGPKTGLIARLVSEKDQRLISIEQVAMPDAQDMKTKDRETKDLETEAESVASTNPVLTKTKSEVDTEIDKIQSEVTKAIDLEMQKALGSLNSTAGGASKANMADLQAKAAAMMKSLNAEDASTVETKRETDAVTFVAQDDKEPIEPNDIGIKVSQCVIKTGKETHTLKYLIAYNQVEDGTATKVLMFSNKPLNEEKLKRMLASRSSVSIYDIGGFESGPTIEMKISGNAVMINAAVSGGSMSTNSSDIKSTVRFRDEKVQGRVVLDKPMKMIDDSFAFEAQINQPVLQIDAKPILPGQTVELTADSEYDFPLPENCDSKSIEGTKYLKQVEASIQVPLKSVAAFYRKEFSARGFRDTKTPNAIANALTYANASGSIDVRLSESGDATAIAMNVQNTAAARADKMIASTGKGLALMGNLSNEPVELTIGGKSVTIPAGIGAKDPKEAMRLELAPGKYQVVWKFKGGNTAKKQLEVTANTTWGVIFDLDFQTVMRLY